MPASQPSSTTPHAEEKPEAQQRPETPKSDYVVEKKKKSSGAVAGVPGVLLAIICLVLEAIIFVFCVVGTPIDCFKAKANTSPRSCYSMWGSKSCGPHKANPSGALYKGFPTSGIRTTMNAAAAFAIISIFMTLVALVLTVLLVCKCIFRVIPGVFSIIAFFTLLIVWACQAGVYHRRYTVAVIGTIELRGKISTSYNYAGSFGLFVTAWCLQTIEMVLVFFA